MPAFRISDECSQQMKGVASVLSVLREALCTKTPLPHSTTLPTLSDIQLPQAPSIAKALKTHCIGQFLAKELTRTYEHHVSDLQKCTEAQIQGLLQHYRDNVISSDILEKQIARYISLYESRVKHWYTLLSNEIKRRKSEFNTERIPLLITYFKHNAYPSIDDRNWLARETGNTPQQIGIWFQNRRRRSRKAGIKLKRAGPDEIPPSLLADDPEPYPPHSLRAQPTKRPRVLSPEVTPIEEVPLSWSSSADATLRPHDLPHDRLRTRNNFTDFEIPPYAFPATYNHPATSSCWSWTPETSFSEPNWARKPSSHRKNRHGGSTATSVDDLSSMMAVKLRLFCTQPSSSAVADAPWHATLYTHPSPSPLPALVRSKRPYNVTFGPTSQMTRSSLKRKRSNINEEQPYTKRFRSFSASSCSSFIGGDFYSSDDSSCTSSSPGPQTPPSAHLSLPLTPRFVDWTKFSIPTVPQAYGLC